MKQNKKKKKIQWAQCIFILLSLVCGGAIGMILSEYLYSNQAADLPPSHAIFSMLILLASIYVGALLQTVIHEAGHLVFGLISGYKFSSFRIMNFMWIKDNGKIKLKRLTVTGTGGQCLMEPPELKDGKIPVTLYNLGGSLLNLISTLIFLAIFLIFPTTLYVQIITLSFVLIGLLFAAINGIPMKSTMMNNDGYNAISISKSSASMNSFWVQLKVSEQTAKGVRLKDMPKEWFYTPSDDEMKNSMVAVMGVFNCNRLMDLHSFDEARQLISHLLEIDSGIVELHRNLLVCDSIYLELIGQRRQETIDKLLTKDVKKFMKAMKNFPSVIRTEYAYALLYEKDAVKSQKAKIHFEKTAKKYPYPSDIQSEWELIAIAEKI